MEISAEYLEFRFTRGGGPGGQNVNKVNTRVTVLYAFDQDPRWDPANVERFRRKLSTRMSADGRIMVTSSRHRTQGMNRDEAVGRLTELVEAALRREKPRRATRPSRAAKERRLTSKRQVSERMQARRSKGEE